MAVSYVLPMALSGLWRGWHGWRGLFAIVSHWGRAWWNEPWVEFTLLLETLYDFADGLFAVLVKLVSYQVLSRVLRSPHTSLTAASSSILRCRSSKIPCPKRASADMAKKWSLVAFVDCGG